MSNLEPDYSNNETLSVENQHSVENMIFSSKNATPEIDYMFSENNEKTTEYQMAPEKLQAMGDWRNNAECDSKAPEVSPENKFFSSFQDKNPFYNEIPGAVNAENVNEGRSNFLGALKNKNPRFLSDAKLERSKLIMENNALKDQIRGLLAQQKKKDLEASNSAWNLMNDKNLKMNKIDKESKKISRKIAQKFRNLKAKNKTHHIMMVILYFDLV